MEALNQREARVRCEAGVPFRLARLSGREELSRPFRYDLALLCRDHDVDLSRLLGTGLTVEIDAAAAPAGGAPRFLHGFVADAAYAGPDGDLARYDVAVVPWLWFLGRQADCRIFQGLGAVDIAARVFQAYPAADFEARGLSAYPARDYCVQYRETDLDFVSRLLEDEGVFYFFEHGDGRHTLVLVDDPACCRPRPGYATMPYFPPDDHRRRGRDHLDAWRPTARVRPGRATLRSFDFENPGRDLTAVEAAPGGHAQGDREVYDYPGGYVDQDRGDALARVRLEELRADGARVLAAGDAAGLCCGARFRLEGFPRRDQNIEHLVVALESTVVAERERTGLGGGGAGEGPYRCALEAMDARLPFRPARTTPRPFVRGPQTAIVTGPAGEEIFTDRHGRVKVQFHWDREGRLDENSSCWLRVSHAWAGAGWGAMQTPRVGQEVIVDFLEGDPDQPIITGRVYNGHQTPPHGLPGGAAKSGMKSASTKGGGGSNELTFDDTKGSERVYMHSQFNHDAVVENNKTETVHNDEHITIDNNRTRSVGANEAVTVGANQTVAVAGAQTLTIVGHRTETVNGGETVTVTGGRSHTVNGLQSTTVSLAETHSVGLGRMHNVGAAESITVGAVQMVNVGAAQIVSVGGVQSFNVSGAHKLSAAAIMKTAKGPVKIKAGATCVIEATKITLQAGGSKIIMDSSGITIKGAKIVSKADNTITLNASSGVKVKGGTIGEN